MKTSFYCCKSAIILTFFLSFSVADALTINSVSDVSVDNYQSYPGSSVDVDFTLDYTARGIGETTFINVEAYASSDSTITEGDYYLGSTSIFGRYFGNGTLTDSLTGSFPHGITSGDYYVGIICQGRSGYDTNPVHIDAELVPDLKLTFIEIQNSDPIVPGGFVSVDYIVENIGSYKPGQFDVYLYASEDTTITRDDYEFSHHLVDSLDPGEHTRISRACYLPEDIPLGDYYVGGVVDCSDDGNIENNSYCGNSFSVILYVDISVQNVSVNLKDTIPGGSINVTVTVENIEQLSSDDYTIGYYASTDTTTYFLGSLERSGLSSGETDTFDYLCQLPQDIPPCQYSIVVKLTCDNDSNEQNNEGWGSVITVVPNSNLEVESVEAANSTYILGDQITVYALIKNIGDVASQAYTVDYYASTDTIITMDDHHLGYVERDGLAPGEQHSCETTYQIPFNLIPDNYYIGMIVTCPEEYDPSNNTGCSEETIELVHPAGYGLVFQSIEVTPGEYLPGEELVIYNLIKNVSDLSTEGYAVDYYASIDTVITTDDHHLGYVEREGLAPGQQHSYETTCLIPDNLIMGNYYIGAVITCPIGSGMAINARCSEEKFELVLSGGNVSGQMLYTTRDYGQVHPIRYALVEVYDADDNEDPNDDRVIGRTHTDKDGNYNVVVLNYEMSSQNIYVKVFTESPIGAYPEIEGKVCSVRDDVFDEIYYMESDLYPHPGDESVVVNMTADKYGGEFMVYDSLIESFENARTFFDINLPEVTTFWPCEEETSYFDPCNLGVYIEQGDRGDRDVIMHEYGHFIAEVYFFAQGSVGDNPIHYWNADLRHHPIQRKDQEARNLAFRESWATLFSIATQYGDTDYPYSGDTRYQDWDEENDKKFEIDLEEDTYDHFKPGEFFENMNCCALWDIFDDKDDRFDNEDTLSDTSLSKIWTIVRNSQPDDIEGFWNGWFLSFEYTSEITRIFQDHEMSFVKPNISVFPSGQNNPPIADAGRDRTFYQTCAEGGYVRLNGHGSVDPDGDKLTYEWRLNDIRIATGVNTWLYMLPGTVTITLAVTDGQEYDYDSVEITVIPTDPSTWE